MVFYVIVLLFLKFEYVQVVEVELCSMVVKMCIELGNWCYDLFCEQDGLLNLYLYEIYDDQVVFDVYFVSLYFGEFCMKLVDWFIVLLVIKVLLGIDVVE